MSDTDHAGRGRYTLTADADGGLALDGVGGSRLAFSTEPSGWTVDLANSKRALKLVRGCGGSMVLEEESDGGCRVATWSPAQPGVGAVSGGTVLMADGDLFQVLDRPGPDGGYDLVGWQGGGAYFATVGGDGRVQVMVHPAGLELLDQVRGEAVLAMFVAVAAGLSAAGADRS